MTASGQRSVAVGGDVSGIVITGDNAQIVLRDGGQAGTVLDAVRVRVQVIPRDTPVVVRPPAYPDRVDRESEARALADTDAPALSVTGPPLVGKSYVVSAAFGQDGARLPPDGMVRIYGRARPLADLQQRLWEELYESRPPTVPSEAALLRDLADRELLVVIDSADLEHDDAQALAAALPRSRLVLVSRERRWWDGEELSVGGLPEGAALMLLERSIGAAIPPADLPAAREVCRLLGRHPVRVRQAGALVRAGDVGLAGLAARLGAADPARATATDLLSRASHRELDVIAALAPFGGEPIGAGHLEALAGPGAAAVAEALADRGLLVRGSPRYALAVDPVLELEPGRLADAEATAVSHALAAPPGHTDADLSALLVLLNRLARSHQHTQVVRLGRRLAPRLVGARLLAAWRTVAEDVLDAATALDWPEAQAWARHELGTHALASGDVAAGRELLQQAVDLRERLDDRRGLQASNHNLGLTSRPPRHLRTIRGLLLALLVLAVVVAAALLFDRPGEVVPTGSGAPTVDPVTEDPDEPVAPVLVVVADPVTIWEDDDTGSCNDQDLATTSKVTVTVPDDLALHELRMNWSFADETPGPSGSKDMEQEDDGSWAAQLGPFPPATIDVPEQVLTVDVEAPAATPQPHTEPATVQLVNCVPDDVVDPPD